MAASQWALSHEVDDLVYGIHISSSVYLSFIHYHYSSSSSIPGRCGCGCQGAGGRRALCGLGGPSEAGARSYGHEVEEEEEEGGEEGARALVWPKVLGTSGRY